MDTSKRRQLKKSKSKPGNFQAVLFGVFTVHFLLFGCLYIFADDGGVATKYWYDFPVIVALSILISGCMVVPVYFGVMLLDRLWQSDTVGAYILKAAFAEISFLGMLFGIVGLYFLL